MMSEKVSSGDTTKREFLKKTAYVVPAVLTLAAAPSFASAGSNSGKNKKPTNKTENNGPKKNNKNNAKGQNKGT